MPNPPKKVKILPESFFFLPENLFLLREKFFLLPEKFLFLKKPGAGPYPKNAKSQKLIFEAHFHLISRKKSPGEFFFSPGEVFFLPEKFWSKTEQKKARFFFIFFQNFSRRSVFFFSWRIFFFSRRKIHSPGELFFSPGEISFQNWAKIYPKFWPI